MAQSLKRVSAILKIIQFTKKQILSLERSKLERYRYHKVL